MKYLKLVVILIIAYVIYKSLTKQENFMDKNLFRTKDVPELKNAVTNKLFDDVSIYESDDDFNGRLGLDKCLENCNGTCVAFGPSSVTGTCFPKSTLDNDNYYNIMRKTSNEHETEEIERVDNIKFASLR